MESNNEIFDIMEPNNEIRHGGNEAAILAAFWSMTPFCVVLIGVAAGLCIIACYNGIKAISPERKKSKKAFNDDTDDFHSILSDSEHITIQVDPAQSTAINDDTDDPEAITIVVDSAQSTPPFEAKDTSEDTGWSIIRSIRKTEYITPDKSYFQTRLPDKSYFLC